MDKFDGCTARLKSGLKGKRYRAGIFVKVLLMSIRDGREGRVPSRAQNEGYCRPGGASCHRGSETTSSGTGGPKRQGGDCDDGWREEMTE